MSKFERDIIRDKLIKEVDTINECIEIVDRQLARTDSDKGGKFADPLEGLEIISKLMTRRRKAAEKFLKLAIQDAPPAYKIHQTLQGLEAQWG